MWSKKRLLVGCALLCGLMATNARADLAPSQNISYQIHQTPSDPASPVTYTILLNLDAALTSGQSVGWTVNSLKIIDQTSSDKRSWTAIMPPVNSPDGLWWIEHADASNPQLSEFTQPPRLFGQASSDVAGQTGLDYDMEGQVPTTSTDQQPYQTTSFISHILLETETQFILADGEGEPVETGDEGPSNPE